MRMVQRGKDLRFATEPCEPFGITRDRGQEHFQGNVAIQLRIVRAIHRSHSAFA